MQNERAEPELSWRTRANLIVLSWTWFFLILMSYYCLKPLRDGLASSLSGNLGNLYLATFASTIVGLSVYSQLVAVMKRHHLVFGVHQFFVACLIAFYFAFRSSLDGSPVLVSIFFVWVSVFNLFVVTLFWSVMADVFTVAQGKAWFGLIAAAGSVGAICGSAVAFKLSQWGGMTALVITSIVGLELATVVAFALFAVARSNAPVAAPAGEASAVGDDHGTGGSLFAGMTRVVQSPYLLGICLLVALGKFAATFIYNNLQATVLVAMPDASVRTTLFSSMNFYSQTGSLIAQSLIAGWIMKRWSVGTALVIPCLIMLAYFVWLSQDGSLRTLVWGQVGQQVLGYGLLTPAQHVLFTVVSREDKYKSKAFTDTVVFRGSDVAAGKVCDWMIRSGTVVQRLAIFVVPIVALWAIIAAMMGSAYRRRAEQAEM
ncbi:MAG: hypothetical protein KDA92_20545 [Planctomycetales bacterium]|nr:hypothetical protein [Planctomycetales bacterium]